jgi:hypothetical protein
MPPPASRPRFLNSRRSTKPKRATTINVVFDTAGATNKQFLADPRAALLITTQALISEGEKSGRLTDSVSYRLGDTVAALLRRQAPRNRISPRRRS